MQDFVMQNTSPICQNPLCNAPLERLSILSCLLRFQSCITHSKHPISLPPSSLPRSSQHVQHQANHLPERLPPAHVPVQARAQHHGARLPLVARLERAGHRGRERLREHVDLLVRAAEDGRRGEVVVWKEGRRRVRVGGEDGGGGGVGGGDVERDVGLGWEC